jgi:hypothetical protein
MEIYNLLPAEKRVGAGVVASRFSDATKGRAWVETLPPGKERESAWEELGKRMPNPIDLPPGPDRDAMLTGNATRFGTVDPVRGLNVVLQIGDMEKRRTALDLAMESFTSTSGTTKNEAHTWLKAADIPAEWKQPWLEGNGQD